MTGGKPLASAAEPRIPEHDPKDLLGPSSRPHDEALQRERRHQCRHDRMGDQPELPGSAPCEGNHPGPGATVGPQPRDDYADAGSSTPFPTRFFTGSLKAEPLSARTRVPCARRRGHHRLSGSRTAPAPDQTATRFGRPEARGGCLRYRGAAISGSWPSRTSAAARRSASSISLWEEYLAMKGCSR